MIVNAWTITLLDGTTETVHGNLDVRDGVLYLTERSTYGLYNVREAAYPLTSVRKWERVER